MESPKKEQGSEAPEKGLTMNLSGTEARLFLEVHGVQRLRELHVGEPLLYLLDDEARDDIHSRWKCPPEEVPNVVRVDAPIYVDFEDSPISKLSAGQRGRIYNEGGRVDYYAIRREKHMPVLVRTSRTDNFTKSDGKGYVVNREDLFRAADDIFPPSTDEIASQSQ